LGRIVEEKGLEYLIDGFCAIDDQNARLLIGGDFKDVMGGSVLHQIESKIAADKRIKLLGFLPEEQIADFYASIDVFTLPSINPFEAFGIVQAEALMLGIPVIASNLPGVRQPVMLTKMGLIVEPRSAKQISAAIMKLKQEVPDCIAGSALAKSLYSLDAVLTKFELTLNAATHKS
jgi:glycosyltransferase involved in cell wall biosynthesis